jgi:hypothetical protein
MTYSPDASQERYCLTNQPESAMIKMIAVSVLAGLLAVPAASQSTAELQVGARARVSIEKEKPVVGRITSVTSSSIGLARKGGEAAQEIPVEQVSRIQVSTGRNRGKGILLKGLIGLGGGALGGAALGALTFNESSDCYLVCRRGDAAAFAGILGGSAGLIVGMIAGATTGWDTWVDATPRR